jgi:hypothetical protein
MKKYCFSAGALLSFIGVLTAPISLAQETEVSDVLAEQTRYQRDARQSQARVSWWPTSSRKSSVWHENSRR